MADKNWIFAVDRQHQSMDVGNRRYYNRHGGDRKQQLPVNGASATTMMRPTTYQSNYSMRPQSYTSNGGYHHQRPTSTLLSTAQQQAQQRLQSINRLNDRIASNRQFVASAPPPPARISSIQQKRRSLIDNDSHHLNIANNDIDSHRHQRLKQQQPSSEYNRKSIMNEFDAAFDRFANRIVDESFDFLNVELNKDKVSKDGGGGKITTTTADRSNHNYIQRSNALPIASGRNQLDRQTNLKKSVRKKKRRLIEHRDENGEIDAVYEEQENQIDIAAEDEEEEEEKVEKVVDEDSGNSTPTKPPPPPPPPPSSTKNVRPPTPQLRRTYLRIPIDIPIVHQRPSEQQQLQSKCVNFRDRGGNTTDDAYGSMDSFGELPPPSSRRDVGSIMLARNSCYYDRCDVCSAAAAGDNVVHAICPVCRCVQHCPSNMAYVIDDDDDVTVDIDMTIDATSPSTHNHVTKSIEPYYGNHAVVADRHHNYRTYQPPRTSIVEYPSPPMSQYGNGSLNRSSKLQHLSADQLALTARQPIVNYSELSPTSTSPAFNGVLLKQQYGDRTLFRVDDNNHNYYQQPRTDLITVDYDLVVQKHRRSRANVKRNRRCIALAVCLIAMTTLIVVAIVLAVNYNC